MEQIAFFEARVRPILADRCFACHSEAANPLKGDLRLDSQEALIKGGKRGPVVVPKDPASSSLIRAIGYTDANLRMPPTGKLLPGEIAALTEWVKMGAPWPAGARKPAVAAPSSRFWAYVPPKRPVPPRVRDTSWAKDPLDRFVLARLEAKSLAPAPPADRVALIRRATFDLTGLPPTIQEIRAFLADTKPGAFARVVDRLLASPAFGERWGRHWLDVVRYADSNGLDENLVYTQAWRYRDYVIRALNQDKPIDRFLQEQIAGDLLPPVGTDQGDQDRIIATGFLSMGPKMLAEDDPVKQEMDLIDEQVDTLGKAFMGLTLGCARCHDHKFDPLPQKDYYALASILKSTKTMMNYKNMAEWQEVPLGAKADVEKQARIDEAIKAKRDDRDGIVRAAREATLKMAKSRLADYRTAAAEIVKFGARPTLAAAIGQDGMAPPGAIVVEAEDYARGNVLKDRDGFGKGIGVLVNAGKYPNRVEYDVDIPSANTYQLDLRYASGDARPVRIYVNGELVTANAAGNVTGGFYPDAQRWFGEGLFAFKAGKNTVVLERDSYFPHIDKVLLLPRPGRPITRNPEQVAVAVGVEPEIAIALADKLKQNPAALTEADIELPDRPERLFATDAQSRIKQLDDAIVALEKSRPVLPRAMAVSDGKPTDLKVHLRGSYLTLGEQCSRGFPVVLGGAKEPAVPSGHSGRLELAQWMTRRDHPLTSRVFVNRVWRWLFGRGIVATVDNFGTLGERPTDPELLDWVATSFAEDGWSLKRLLRRLMLSGTYQMSSRLDPRAYEADPENRLQWRHERRRLEAEEIRDSILMAGGLLDRTMGGSLLKFRDREYVTSTANSDPVNYKSSRRSVYLPVIRSALYDVYTAFDFGDPTVMNGDRSSTTVAPQALFMMNSSLVLDSSKAMAESLLSRSDLDDAGRIRTAFETCYGREPSGPEAARCLAAIKRLDDAFSGSTSDPAARRRNVWQSFCKTLLGASEFIFVD